MFKEFLRLVEENEPTPEEKQGLEKEYFSNLTHAHPDDVKRWVENFNKWGRGEMSFFDLLKGLSRGITLFFRGNWYHTGDSPKIGKMLPLDKILSVQKFKDPKVIDAYLKQLQANPEFETEPINAYPYHQPTKDGQTHYLQNGNHRYDAYKLAGRKHIPVFVSYQESFFSS